jgi:TatD family-associated radical SAM protein
VRVDTNGHAFLLYPERDVVAELKEAGVSKVSVSLNAYNKATYNEVCCPGFEGAFEGALEFIKRARDGGLDVEVTAVSIPEIEVSKVEKIASDLEVKFRVRAYLPCIW